MSSNEIKQIAVSVITVLMISAVAGEVVIEPRSYTILPNAHVVSVCKGINAEFSYIQFLEPVSTDIVNTQTEKFGSLSNYGVQLSVQTSGYNITWNVSITGTVTVSFKCRFLQVNSFTYHISNKAVITVINDTVLGAPTITQYNETFIELIWSPLEYFNATNYTVNVYNTSSGTVSQIVTEGTSIVLTRERPSVSSNPLNITVVAFTEVGSVTSAHLVTGFPKTLVPVNKASIHVEVLKKQDGTIRTVVTFTRPEVFSFQVPHYYIKVHDLNNSNIYFNFLNITGSSLVIDGQLQENRCYRLSIVSWEELREDEMFVTNVTFCTNFSSTPAPPTTVSPTINLPTSSAAAGTNPSSSSSSAATATAISPTASAATAISPTASAATSATATSATTSVTATTSTSAPTATATTSASAPTAPTVNLDSNKQVIIGVAAGSGGLIFVALIVVIVLVLLLVLLLRTRRIRRINNVVKEQEEVPYRERKLSIPQVMATNPLYEATTPVYDCLPQDIKGLSTSPAHAPFPHSLYSEIPPQVPPPRKMTLDSPGYKSGTEVTLSKVSVATEQVDNEDYIYMKAGQAAPRYVKSPLTGLKTEEITPSAVAATHNKNCSTVSSTAQTASVTDEGSNEEKQ